MRLIRFLWILDFSLGVIVFVVIFCLFLGMTNIISYCSRLDCDRLPTNYSSFTEAIDIIQTAHFNIQESVNTSNSSWIRRASYYSCDGKMGYLIIRTDEGEYIHSDMPTYIWEEFKNAESYGSFYNQYIKHRYYFTL